MVKFVCIRGDIYMNPYELMTAHESEFTKSDEIIRDSILNNPEIIIKYNIISLAERINVSKSAILRFCKKLGYSGFSDFKFDMSRFIHSGAHEAQKHESTIEEVLEILEKSIHNLRQAISPQVLHKLAEDICNAKTVRLFGIMSSSVAATQLMYRLFQVGIPSQVVSDYFILNEINECASKDDLHIFFSASGNSFDITNCKFDDIAAKTVLITQNNRTNFHDSVNEVIVLPSFDKNILDFYLEPQYLNLAFIEILVCEVSKVLSNKNRD